MPLNKAAVTSHPPADKPLPTTLDSSAGSLLASARRVFEVERDAIGALCDRIDASFAGACQLLMACAGRVIVTGMGKSGHIGRKIAATLASTGTPAHFVHPGEASHGDMGMMIRGDVVIAISYSGESSEVLTILPLIKRMGLPLISLTGRSTSTLARAANVHLDVSVSREACSLNLAPTASTTAALAMGDALAVALLDAKGFTADDFAASHPSGSLGRRLLLRVSDVMHVGDRMPKVMPDVWLAEALMEMSRKGLGMTAIVDADDRLLGVFTDGDLRRVLDQGLDIRATPVAAVMTPDGKTIAADSLAAEAVNLMQKHSITQLLVTGPQRRLIGALHMHDLLRAGVM
jgi:arabinose-5-phosphate isomerase